ncbi:Hepatocyte growth factor-regulated tyrosine kinase substrate [Echinococcus granulosus]|uniref:Hepatocyte growth factor-regulated tyrosine kinase substrate n=1 Tax=Echinococcus granulosus TaxID=6210 RepID=W6U915_ECHGR|nr:Hepatocyte growth factor-regulated tyrosine kinase substrate [Echinococcus granulosus]EUB57490.1 Hepatocyte growth factor-regulated tyrosine kinase substrate [Echinococcus granulosus]
MFRNSRFDKLLAKSTSELLMEADWETNLTICDLVRGQEVTPKDAINSLKKRLNPENPHVLMLGLSVLEALMKNCGTPIHDEVLGTDFVTYLLEYTHTNEEVRSRIFGFIQNWEFAFKKSENYHYLHEAYDEIKRSGYPLPPFHESEAMFSAEVAPNWKDGDECFRCKSTFTTFRRKHHCRNCGNVFCGECTTGRAGIPKYGIEKEVRVCDSCLHDLTRLAASGGSSAARKKENKHGTLREFLSEMHQQEQEHQHQQRLQKQKEQAAKEAKEKQLRLQEEEELQLALALSASEAESKKMQPLQQQHQTPSASQQQTKLPTSSSATVPPAASIPPPSDAASDLATEVDPELARYLNRNYWSGRAAATDSDSFAGNFIPSAPVLPPPLNPEYVPSVTDPSNERLQELERALVSVEIPPEGSALPDVPPLTTAKQEEFLTALRKSLDVFSNRMRVCSQRGRQVATDSTLQTLFKTLHQMNLQLMQYSNDLEVRRTSLEKLQDQTAQIREAREALDDLRRDYAEQRRREEEEAHRQRQILMMQKVEVLRQQKRDAMEAQSRQLMEQSMAFQQQYGQYGYAQPTVYNTIPSMPPMMAYGASAMGYPQGTEYYAQPQQPQAPYDPSLQQQPQPSVEIENPTPNVAAAVVATNGRDDQPPRIEQKPGGTFDVQNMIQSLPAPLQPPVEYVQPGGPPVPSTLIDQMPAPPSDELGSSSRAAEGENTRLKPPTPQLICLE